jgi:hypothetical protein
MRALYFVVVIAACTPQYHVQLPAPSPTITPDARVATFWQMRPRKEGVQTINGTVVNDTIMLGDNKTEVVSPEDLEPLVPVDSETMRYARASVRVRNKSNWLFRISVPLVIGGATTYTFVDGNVGLIGAGVALISLIPYMMSRSYAHDELALRRRAFEAYPADLGRRLNVCAHVNQVIPCEAPLPQAAPPQATPPQPTSVPVDEE